MEKFICVINENMERSIFLASSFNLHKENYAIGDKMYHRNGSFFFFLSSAIEAKSLEPFLEDSYKIDAVVLETLKREKEERERQRHKEEQEKNRKEQEEDDSNRKHPEEYFIQEDQRRAIKEALNNQTFVQFKSYAEQQYPNDLDQQKILITKLQEQHYEQYMQQIVQQRLISDRMNGRSSISTPSSPSSSQSQKLESPLIRKEDGQTYYQSTTGHSNNLHSTSSPTKSVSSPSSSSGFYSSPSSATPTSSLIRINSLTQSTFQEGPEDKSSLRKYKMTEKTDESHSTIRSEGNETTGKVKNSEDVGANGDEIEGDIDESGPEDYDSVESPRMWTTKDIVNFKESIRSINGDGIIKVGHGEIVTVRVPTHPEGTCIFWEFATDSYDIGFGLFFEWTKNPGTQVSVHISESEDDDEDEEDECIGPNIEGNPATDPEKGSHSSKCISPDELPTAVILPIYRRDCHEEVFAGSHAYPGKGAYHLKFDNSYSLWRSKTLYYRVYYTK
ncbi:protein TMED8-like [Panonychus citri]|uniref:protein TMED8-like n=1 Tax=Panonychus citri TaxID=50023 RepID=UPI002307E3E6|nr:protein TMED8-like [Panonychus citri]